jgi:SAM-dependent methyltransferase
MMNNTVIAEDYKNFTLNLASVRNLDIWLETNYEIKCFENEFEPSHYLLDVPDREKKHLNALHNLIGNQKATITKATIEAANIYARDPWRQIWFSKRRAWTIDSVAMISAVIELIRTEGKSPSYLDVGCHIGFLPRYICEKYTLLSTGIDIAEDAIRTAKKLASPYPVEFLCQSPSDITKGRTWEVVSAVDLVQPNQLAFKKIMKSVCDLVAQNGTLIVIGNYIKNQVVLDYFRELGFSCLSAQLTGGYHHGLSTEGFPDWNAKAAYHFKKTKNIDGLLKPISGDQFEFADYANSGEYPPREINRSYFLARKL